MVRVYKLYEIKHSSCNFTENMNQNFIRHLKDTGTFESPLNNSNNNNNKIFRPIVHLCVDRREKRVRIFQFKIFGGDEDFMFFFFNYS